jgi:ectoine hydroxylase-related dioxygenase (phytanoyl-CoA dioxygenase family)
MSQTSVLASGRQITNQDRAAFEELGYHIIREALTQAEVRVYRSALVRMLQVPEDHPYVNRLMSANIAGAPPTPINPRCIWAGFDLPLFDDIFYDFAFHAPIVEVVAALIGPDVNLYETSSVHKVPGFPGNYRDWHQDTEYSDPQSNDSIVTVITYLDDQDGYSGGTWVADGTHRLGAIPHQVPEEAVTSGAREVIDKKIYDLSGHCPSYSAGDTLIFKSRLIHKSGANQSDRDRLSLAYNYVAADTLDLKEINRYIGSATPVARSGRVYRPGQKVSELLAHS